MGCSPQAEVSRKFSSRATAEVFRAADGVTGFHSAFPAAFVFTARAVHQRFCPFRWFFPGPGFPLAAGKVWCHLVVMSNAQLLARITMDADICHGKPCIRGLRYPVEWLLELLSGDMTEPQILADYPDLEAADLRAAIAYAARLSRIKSIEPVAA
jgi:uncharacterized protein (DUF433 family)